MGYFNAGVELKGVGGSGARAKAIDRFTSFGIIKSYSSAITQVLRYPR